MILCKWCGALGIFLNEHSICDVCARSIQKELKQVFDREESIFRKIENTQNIEVKISSYKRLIDQYCKLMPYEKKGLFFSNRPSKELIIGVYNSITNDCIEYITKVYVEAIERSESSTSLTKVLSTFDKAIEKIIEARKLDDDELVEEIFDKKIYELQCLKEVFTFEILLEEASKELYKGSNKKAKQSIEEARYNVNKESTLFYNKEVMLSIVENILQLIEENQESLGDKNTYNLVNQTGWKETVSKWKEEIILSEAASKNIIGSTSVVSSTNDNNNGHVNFTSEDGTNYDGDYIDGCISGKGKMTYDDGSFYEGEWNNNKKHGKGTYSSPNGLTYIGEWHEDNMHGEGKGTLPDGSFYEGTWKDGKMHGYGVLEYANGEKYEGEYKDGMQHGIGQYVNKDGLLYNGDFFEDTIHGKGTMIYPDGEEYEGEWRNGVRHGKGYIKFPSGATYEGNIENEDISGYGIMIVPDGRKYEGEWKNNSMNGYGIMFSPDGEKIEGEWCDGECVNPVSESDEYKLCPFCAEKIKIKAIKCRYCQSMLN